MKNGVTLLLSGVIGILMLAIVMTVCGNMNRSVELQVNLSTAMESTMKNLSEYDDARSNLELLAECIEDMVFAMDSDMEVALEVYQTDVLKKILSLHTVGRYVHPNGMDGEVEWERTVIYEKKGETEEMETCEVSFYRSKEDLLREGTCYKRFLVAEGECITAPVEPQISGEVFAGWKDSNDYMADFSQPVLQNLCYYAAWE